MKKIGIIGDLIFDRSSEVAKISDELDKNPDRSGNAFHPEIAYLRYDELDNPILVYKGL